MLIIEKVRAPGRVLVATISPAIIIGFLAQKVCDFRLLQDVKVQTILPRFATVKQATLVWKPGAYARNKFLTLAQAAEAMRSAERDSIE